MRFRICWTLPLLAVLLPALPARAATEKDPPPDLSGRWKLNEDVTYRMMQGMRERGSGGGHDGMRGAGGGGRPGGHGGGGRPAGDGSRRRPEHHGGPPVSLESLDELTITQKEGVVTITDAAGRSRVLRTDGKKVREEGAPGGPATVKAKWKDRALEVTVKPQKGPKRTESWVITNDRKRLFLTLTMDGGPRVPIRRAYDLVSQGEDQETPAPLP